MIKDLLAERMKSLSVLGFERIPVQHSLSDNIEVAQQLLGFGRISRKHRSNRTVSSFCLYRLFQCSEGTISTGATFSHEIQARRGFLKEPPQIFQGSSLPFWNVNRGLALCERSYG